ncbi:MAG: NAD(P)-dependent oxidoreductase [Candidatus Aminicenantes bacterium]|jgi:phosphoglycerate dehydrogenase-like enzyme
MIKIWKNTKTLDGLVNDLIFTGCKKEAHIALLGSKPIQLEDFPNLKGIFRAGVSKDNVPIEEANQKGIKVAFPSPRTIDFIYEETANFTCFLILKMVYSHLGTLSPWVKFPRGALQNKELLVIGKGNIGRRVWQKMKPFMKVLTYDVVVNSPAELESLLKEADVVSLHIPNLPENKDFMDAEKLALMKDQAILINTARGALVSEAALYRELEKQRLYAAFDVYWQEPYEGKLKKFHPHRFFMTPHVASTCDAFLKGSAEDLRKLVKEIEK